MPWNRRRGLNLALFLLSIYAVNSDTGENQQSEHGLSGENDPGDPSPAMAAFFGGRSAAPLPVARNTTDPVWGVAGKVSPANPSSSGWRRRTMLLVAGVICGVVGVGLLVAAAAYTVRTRRPGQPTEFGPGSLGGPSRWINRRETSKGTA